MRAVIINFLDQMHMEDFIKKYKLSYIKTDRTNYDICGFLTEQQIVDALYYYEGELTIIKPTLSLFM